MILLEDLISERKDPPSFGCFPANSMLTMEPLGDAQGEQMKVVAMEKEKLAGTWLARSHLCRTIRTALITFTLTT